MPNKREAGEMEMLSRGEQARDERNGNRESVMDEGLYIDTIGQEIITRVSE